MTIALVSPVRVTELMTGAITSANGGKKAEMLYQQLHLGSHIHTYLAVCILSGCRLPLVTGI